MINILIVEDSLEKLGRLKQAVLNCGIEERQVRHAFNSVEAMERLLEMRFDLVLLDVNIPRRFDEPAVRGEGLELLRRVSRDPDVHKPRYVVGVTAYDDVVEEFGEDFADQLWSLIHYSENSDRWQSQVNAKIDYIRALRESDNFSDGRTYGIDVALICALPDVELSAVKELPCEWQPLRLPHDQTHYLTGTIEAKGVSISIVAAAAPRMGMPASAVLASKMVSTFRPKILGMTGICAGRASKTGLGDVVIAEPAFDWGSGKIDSHAGEPRFRPSPHQLDLNVDLAAFLKNLFDDVGLLATIRSKCNAAPNRGDLKVRVAPMASGASVVANAKLFEELLDGNRDITGLEMEAYGIFVAANGCAKPRPIPLVMKSVCDFADEDKDDDYQRYAAQTSARCFYEAIKRLYESGTIRDL